MISDKNVRCIYLGEETVLSLSSEIIPVVCRFGAREQS